MGVDRFKHIRNVCNLTLSSRAKDQMKGKMQLQTRIKLESNKKNKTTEK